LIEFGSRQCIVATIKEGHKIEDVALAVVQINRTGSGLIWDALQEQNASRHLDPARGQGLADIEKRLHDVLDTGLWTQANVGGCKQRFKPYCSSALKHVRLLSILSEFTAQCTQIHAKATWTVRTFCTQLVALVRYAAHNIAIPHEELSATPRSTRWRKRERFYTATNPSATERWATALLDRQLTANHKRGAPVCAQIGSTWAKSLNGWIETCATLIS
jgi:hypothetical protein